MSWTLNVDLVESCSCAAMCPCLLGPAKPDQGWCSGVFGLNITRGNSDGVDLSGAKVVMHFELQGDFISGIDKAKLYLDPSLSESQRTELDAIFHGEKGGLWGGMREAIKQWLPSAVAPIQFGGKDSPGVKVEGYGEVVIQPIFAEEGGAPTRLVDSPVARAFGMGSENLGFANGTKFSDPDLRDWESLGAGGTSANVVWSS
jgi:hypothetical protein